MSRSEDSLEPVGRAGRGLLPRGSAQREAGRSPRRDRLRPARVSAAREAPGHQRRGVADAYYLVHWSLVQWAWFSGGTCSDPPVRRLTLELQDTTVDSKGMKRMNL